MRKRLLSILLGVVVCLPVGCATNPITGEDELMLFSEDDDVSLGRKYAPEIEKELKGKIDDPAIEAYINQVGQRIVQVSHKTPFQFHFAALNDEMVNAFALPGGYIYVTRGMLERIQTEAQLAAVLAHETVHVVARDVSNAMSNQIGLSLLLAAAASSGDAPAGALRAADLAAKLVTLTFSRKDEREADLGGLDYMIAAGYNPYGMVETMQMLENEEKTKPVEFLSTHPSPENRIGYITQKIQAEFYGIDKLKAGQDEYRKAVLERLGKPKEGEFEIRVTLAQPDKQEPHLTECGVS
jgi:predicted Zn-dependent protease